VSSEIVVLEAHAQETDAGVDGDHDANPAPSRLALLDGFQLQCDGRVLDLPFSAQRLLAFLGVHERPLLRSFVAGSLWLDKTDERSYANLRSALWRLGQAAGPVVECRGNHLRVSPAVEVDLRTAAAVARNLIAGGAHAVDAGGAVSLLAGDLLPDWYDEWVAIERERFRQLRLHALEALCVELTAAGRLGEAIDVGMAAIATEPLRESSHRALIEAHLAEGNVAEAARQFESFRALLWETLGVPPSNSLTARLSGLVDLDIGWRRDEMATAR
jgi:DNA-binding SARP family transcriptional activator